MLNPILAHAYEHVNSCGGFLFSQYRSEKIQQKVFQSILKKKIKEFLYPSFLQLCLCPQQRIKDITIVPDKFVATPTRRRLAHGNRSRQVCPAGRRGRGRCRRYDRDEKSDGRCGEPELQQQTRGVQESGGLCTEDMSRGRVSLAAPEASAPRAL